jgi:hypothetical protein
LPLVWDLWLWPFCNVRIITLNYKRGWNKWDETFLNRRYKSLNNFPFMCF